MNVKQVPGEELRLPPFPVTRAAIDQLAQIGGTVRVDLVPGGCCGTTWHFTAAGSQPGDEVYGCDGAWLAVAARAHDLLSTGRLDYGAWLRPPRYRVLGVDADTCPCNRSLGRAWPGRGQPHCCARVPMPWDSEERAGVPETLAFRPGP